MYNHYFLWALTRFSTTRNAILQLGRHRSKLSRQQLKTLRGQILSGDIDGAMRGLDKILKQKMEAHHGIQNKN